MVTPYDKRSDQQSIRPLAGAAAQRAQRMQMVDNRREGAVQRKISGTISNSAMMVAQRQMLNKIFGGVAQRADGMLEDELAQKKSNDTVQRAGALDEELTQKKSNDTVQRAGALDEELAQKKSNDTVQRAGALEDELAQPKFKQGAQQNGSISVQKKENNTGLPDNLKSGVENLSGVAMDDVKVHYGSDKPAQLNALAYAQGTDIHVAPGQERHLPHEAWHVVQQKEGRVQPTMQMNEVPVNDDAGLEKEADTMGEKALRG